MYSLKRQYPEKEQLPLNFLFIKGCKSQKVFIHFGAVLKQRHKMPLEILETLSTSDAVIFLASKSLLQNHDRLPSFSSLKKAVVTNNDIYAIDFSDTNGIKFENEVQKIVQKKLAVSFKCDLLIITKFKNRVMFSPIEDKHSLDDGNMVSVKELQEHLKVLSENKMRKAGIFCLF